MKQVIATRSDMVGEAGARPRGKGTVQKVPKGSESRSMRTCIFLYLNIPSVPTDPNIFRSTGHKV